MTSTAAGEVNLDFVFESMPHARMQKYLDAAGHRKVEGALDLYRWNLKASTALWEVICHAEVTLRHAIDISLSERHEQLRREDDWVFYALEVPEGTSEMGSCFEDLSKAYGKLKKRVGKGKGGFERVADIGADDVIAAVDFGFWKFMVSGDKEIKFGTRIRRGFDNAPRGKTSNDMAFLRQVVNPLHTVRNRIAHHEPICFESGNFIKNKFDNAIALIGYFDDNLRDWARDQSALDQILETKPYMRRR
ncbi:hypothetical protein CH294_26795 [Rhodococcus sp. 14-2483-1-1]|uniref:Abi family protein n=1 Tax=unclassified Rhodococcus (in: high G+C Gram-positive bacteria) TaxID=192944 RepID=UPI000B9AC910|nr:MULTISPECIES: Abi family protein [unclassified Rhodococcus (in: high G+C Gram-positive bacteria)]OZC69779.1 hypothetical protein CH276_02625 [Rhodococcus sp. 06-470-2]OZD01942.1 hypothetical protein CH275_17845 [Rhodococcus sp. 06-235-1A]OZD67414.1 hypothetical protein CH271_14180 [Rhodococcus sp. 05-340-2]OZD71863.1 hypothetical protein CH272_23510 [Rhodococcus sp. 05-340-1]OZE27113.1 hypothetical protein CH262_03415 [Rhodococcus sp. 05-2255-1e]